MLLSIGLVAMCFVVWSVLCFVFVWCVLVCFCSMQELCVFGALLDMCSVQLLLQSYTHTDTVVAVIHTYRHRYAYILTCMCIYICIFTNTCMCVYICIFTNTCVCVYVYIYIYVY